MSFKLSRPKNSRRVRQSSWRGDEFFASQLGHLAGSTRVSECCSTALSVLLDHMDRTCLQLRLCIKTPDTWFVVADLSVQREEGEGKIYDPLDASMDLNALLSMLLLRDLHPPVDRTHQDNVAINCGPRELRLQPPTRFRYLSLENHISWKVLREDGIDPSIHTEFFRALADLLTDEAWLEEDFWAAKTFRADSDDVAVMKLVGLLLVRTRHRSTLDTLFQWSHNLEFYRRWCQRNQLFRHALANPVEHGGPD